MSKVETLSHYIEEQQKNLAERETRHLQEIKDWIVVVEGLYADIDIWVGPLLSSGLEVKRTPHTVRERPDGKLYTYVIDRLVVKFAHIAVTLTPEAACHNSFGSPGVLTIRSGKLLRTLQYMPAAKSAGYWKVQVTRVAPMMLTAIPFDEEIFLDILLEVFQP